MAERLVSFNGLKLWLFAGQFCFICISLDTDLLSDTSSRCCFEIRISKSVYKFLLKCSDDEFINYIVSSYLYHNNIILNVFDNAK